ncbi:MAG: patatin family protein [Lachnospiraceae bacterium]|nr:patatin family protein [Lachnospiraceae bacterium]
MYEAGLVLEGGGMRGLYTAGVLDFFIEKKLAFSSCYGVSAGACHLASYMSGQRGRAYRISVDYLDDKNYCSAYSLLKTGDLFNVDMCYNQIPNELDPFDYEAAEKYPGRGVVVVTDIKSGQAKYVELKNMRRDLVAIRASASLPLVSRNVEINGKMYLDGGMSDSIPIRKSLRDGNLKNIVVLTRPDGYRKKPTSNMAIMRAKYKDYPGVVRDMENRHIVYNKSLDFVKREEKAGRAFVFRPENLIKIERIEKDPKKLRVLYLQGYYDAATRYKEMKKFLEE